jgi:hypothetical protein
MVGFRASTRFVFLLACLLQPTASPAETVAVRYPEGVSHGFLVLRTQDGKPIADGDSTQVARGDRVTSRMRFRFRDGSIYEETTVFSQHGTFRLLSDHVLEKGPTFKRPMETEIDATSGQVTVRYTDDGKEKVLTERLELPPDVANGILSPRCRQRYPFYVVKERTTACPRNDGVLCGSHAKPQGQEPFSIGSYTHKAIHYVVKVKIGGVAGLVAHVLGKQPPATQAWVLADDAPAFVRSDGPLYGDGPIWRMELAVPAAWPDSTAALRSQK